MVKSRNGEMARKDKKDDRQRKLKIQGVKLCEIWPQSSKNIRRELKKTLLHHHTTFLFLKIMPFSSQVFSAFLAYSIFKNSDKNVKHLQPYPQAVLAFSRLCPFAFRASSAFFALQYSIVFYDNYHIYFQGMIN